MTRSIVYLIPALVSMLGASLLGCQNPEQNSSSLTTVQAAEVERLVGESVTCSESELALNFKIRSKVKHVPDQFLVSACLNNNGEKTVVSKLNLKGKLKDEPEFTKTLAQVKVSVYTNGSEIDSLETTLDDGRTVRLDLVPNDFGVPENYMTEMLYVVSSQAGETVSRKLMYKAMPENNCPYDYFKLVDKPLRFRSADGAIKLEYDLCTRHATHGTTARVPLQLRFFDLPEEYSRYIWSKEFSFEYLSSKVSHHNFQNSIEIINTNGVMIHDNDRHGRLHTIKERYPSGVSDYFLAFPKGSGVKDVDLIRECLDPAPERACSGDEQDGEYFCWGEKWHCSHEQQSLAGRGAIPNAKEGEQCGEYPALIDCEKGLTCSRRSFTCEKSQL